MSKWIEKGWIDRCCHSTESVPTTREDGIWDEKVVKCAQENHRKPSHTREELLQDNNSELLINILDKGREDGGGGKLACSDVMRQLR